MSAFTLVILGLLMTTCHSQYQQPQLGSNNYEDYENDYNRRQEEAPQRNYANAPAPREGKAIAAKPTPPVAILKQINRHNEDGSYTYGFEGADGSFKIETKLANGEVKGKYGFVDDTGMTRVVEYGANQYGFQPAGEGITVAPPTLVDETTDKNQQPIDYDYPQGPANLKQQEVQRPAPPPPPPQPRPQRPQYQPPEGYAAQPKTPIFTPAAQSQFSQQFDYAERPPVSQALNQGPVQFNPAPAREAQPSSLARNVQRAAHNAGVLDQLAKEYALPQDAAAPLHDISFGYYK
ncbi:cuticular protein 97Ea [Cotesia typhae]|uniref:cuticular protein 97Ea n=1 Tax=Cotesia typhae TaxID=2053667 RepID=UPI003D682232